MACECWIPSSLMAAITSWSMASAAKLARQNQQAASNTLPIILFEAIIFMPRESTLTSNEVFKRLVRRYSLQNRFGNRYGILRK
jgi:hypothetical protein